VTATATRLLDLRIVPIEVEPLAHLLPGSSVLHLGADTAAALASGVQSPAEVVEAAHRFHCASVAVVRSGCAMPPVEVLDAVHAAGLRCIAIVDADHESPAPVELLRRCDAVLVETSRDLPPWLDVLVEDLVWVEVLARLSADHNDGDASIHALSSRLVEQFGPDVPVHFAAVADHPVPVASLRRARSIGLGDGLHYVYASPVDDPASGITLCPGCGEHLIERNGAFVSAYRLTPKGRCHACGTWIAGRFDSGPSGRAAAVSLAGDDR
jgi:pyruvate formate lyase activating enzyme